MTTNQVKLFNAAMDEVTDSPMGIVLRGALDISTLQFLLVDDYQRQVQAYSSQKMIISALEDNSRLPDIEIGMRGQKFTEGKDGVWSLRDPCYIIDGLQRVSTILEYIKRQPDKLVSIGATVHFNTERLWEKDRFDKLNNNRKRLSPNVTLRNIREENRAVLTLYGLSNNDADFTLYDRVSWEQNMRRNDLISALVLLKISNKLHLHIVLPSGRLGNGFVKGNRGGANPKELGDIMLRRAEQIGINVFRNNVRTFFGAVDDIWGIKSIKYKDAATWMHGAFLQSLARFFSEHTLFWPQNKLFIGKDAKDKLRKFAIDDPSIAKLCGSSSNAVDLLFNYLVEHYNSGKRTGRLVRRTAAQYMEAAE